MYLARYIKILELQIDVLDALPPQVLLGYNDLSQYGFQPTSDELEAKTASMIMLTIPVIIVLLSLFNWKLLKIYYQAGHPWARIYKEFPCNEEKNEKNSRADENQAEV